ncbi:VOC family protein [Chitinophaga sp. XS-30]|uniref:VOC family protein n=1 Tax=Chitinophaga sp. XS-30 TaxID=2604421 RepID=UPI001AF016F4|nr:VOC family protein [Chitinophaga sp. XS-30]
MKKFFPCMALVAAGLIACADRNKLNEQPQNKIKTENSMSNLVSIIEIPAADLGRAIKFYSAILGVSIEEAEMGDVKMGVFPAEEGTVNVVLANGSDYTPTASGSVLYLNGGDDLQIILDKIAANGGEIIMPKTAISPEMGFYALFTDTEGNKLGLHSAN